MNLCVLHDPDALARAAAEQFVELARSSILSRALFTVALSGGSTPRRLYQYLAATPFRDQVDRSRVEVFWGDERGVPPDHPESNYRMASAALLDRVPIPRRSIHRIIAERIDRSSAARDYQLEIARADPQSRARGPGSGRRIGQGGHAAVLEGPHDPERRPIQLVHPEHGRMIWLVDEAAASELEPRAVVSAGAAG